jgi:hypothetical protein
MGNGPKPGNGNGHGNSPAPVTVETVKVEFEGPIDAVSATSLTVDDQEIGITSQTVIRKGDRNVPFSELKKGDRVHVSADQTGTVVVATEIKLQNPCNTCVVDPPPPPDPAQVVSVMASDAEAVEGSTGTFRLSRTGTQTQLGAQLPVTFTLGGTASATDYSAPLSATFGAGVSTVDVTVTAATDAASEPAETVVLLLVPGAGYVVGAAASATVMIVDPPPVVDLRLADEFAFEFDESSGWYELTRGGDLSQELAVTVEFSGTATLGSDYVVSATCAGVPCASPVVVVGQRATVTFPVGLASVRVFVTAKSDPEVDRGETIIMTIIDGAAYDLGPTTSGTVTIDAEI